jgi:8-oxo-dGTP diphosphatase
VSPRVVVAAALVDGSGRLLAARRTAPAALAGRWELPGGKVERGESERDALHRELREELGVEVTLGERLPAEWPLGPDYVLHVYLATMESGDPEPLADHDEVRWLEPGTWADLDWLAADRPAVTAAQAHLSPRGDVL